MIKMTVKGLLEIIKTILLSIDICTELINDI